VVIVIEAMFLKDGFVLSAVLNNVGNDVARRIVHHRKAPNISWVLLRLDDGVNVGVAI